MNKIIEFIKKYKYHISVLLGIICSLFYGARIEFWPVAIFAPILMLIYSRHCLKKRAFIILYIGNALAYFVRFYNFIDGYFMATTIMSCVVGVLFTFLFVIDNKICRYNKCLGIFAYPVLHTLLEIIFIELNPGGAIISFSLSFVNTRALIQTVSIYGPHVLTFIALLLCSFSECIITNRFKKKYIFAGASLLIIAFILTFGIIRVNKLDKINNEADTKTIMGAIWHYAGTMGDDTLDNTYEECELYLEESITKAKQENVDLLCFYEEAFYIYKEDQDKFINYAKELLNGTKIVTVIPLEVYSDDSLMVENKEFIINPDGTTLEYYKSFLVPIVETSSVISGTRDIVKTSYDNVVYSSIICCDDTISSYVSRVEDDTDVLVIPSWDWKQIHLPHTNTTVLRAVENGINIVKVNYGGDNLVIDTSGKITYQYNPDDEGYDTYWISEYNTNHVETIFSKCGKVINIVFASILSCYIGFCIALLIKENKKNKKEKLQNKGEIK